MDDFSKKENDIEKEEGNEHIKIEIPFDPNAISINIIPRTIGQLVDMLRHNEILIPAYQQLPNLWDRKKKSRFIESLMLNLPIPLFYFDEADDKRWRVIDGLQRMSTLDHFILGGKQDSTISGNRKPLVLTDMEFRIEYNGKTWDDLPRDIQRRIETNQVTINLIGKGTPEEVKYNIFSRINQGGIELTPQEIRTALFQGERINFIEQLVSSETEAGKSFENATDNSVPSKRQEDLYFATRFISFYILGYETYEPDMDLFLTNGTKSIPKDRQKQQEILISFTEAMNLAYAIFGKYTFRKIQLDKNKRNQINKPLFEIISVGFARLSQAERNTIRQQKEVFKTAFIDLQKDKLFWDAITTGTATKDSVKRRHELFNDKLIKRFLQ
jgi:hypothetical protein